MTVSDVAKVACVTLVLWFRFGSMVNLKAARRLALYPSLNLAYNRVKKVANTTVVMLLREMDGHALESRTDAKRNSLNLLTLPYSEIIKLPRYRFFVITRNPFSRVLSAFLQKFQSNSYRQRYRPFDLNPSGFAAFIHWLKEEGLDKDPHWDLQVKSMLLPLAKYDTVIRFEKFETEMLSLLERNELKIAAGRLQGLHPRDVNKRTAADSRLEAFYTPAVARMVAELFERDFRELGYSTNFPGDEEKEPGRGRPGY